MRNYFSYFIILILSLVLGSCDDGRIYPAESTGLEGKVVKLTGTVSGLENWSNKYNIELAAFDKDEDYAVISKVVTADEDGNVSVVLSGITDDCTKIELCALNKLRRKVVSFSTMDLEATASDTIYMSVEDLDISMFNAIQQNVFNTTCANCHGASNYAAADLYLTEGKSYQYLVNKASSKVENYNIVEPGDTSKSVLHKVLNTDLTTTWRYSHTSEITSDMILTLIDNWILNGAKEN